MKQVPLVALLEAHDLDVLGHDAVQLLADLLDPRHRDPQLFGQVHNALAAEDRAAHADSLLAGQKVGQVHGAHQVAPHKVLRKMVAGLVVQPDDVDQLVGEPPVLGQTLADHRVVKAQNVVLRLGEGDAPALDAADHLVEGLGQDKVQGHLADVVQQSGYESLLRVDVPHSPGYQLGRTGNAQGVLPEGRPVERRSEGI